MRTVLVIALVAIFATTAYAATCAEYCTLLQTACAGDSGTANAYPYFSYAGCLKVCATIPSDGTDGATSGNTLQCRIYHAGVANGSTTAAETHCKHAGSGGGGTCGSTCDAYCNVMTYTSTTPNAASILTRAPYADTAACNAHCLRWFQTSGGQPIPEVTTGNNAECREYHARAGMELDGASSHYNHALPESTVGTCTRTDATGTYTSAVENYCDYHLAYCGNTVDNSTSMLPYYSSRAACLTQASLLPRGWVSDGYSGNTSNSLDCRSYHAGVASADNTHCYHSGMNGIDQCGTSVCDSYCQLISDVCTSSNAQYTSYADCKAECMGFPGSEATGASAAGPFPTSGNTFKCRFYHLSVAAVSTASADITAHCGHAGPTGSSVCGSVIEGYCNLVLEACPMIYPGAGMAAGRDCENHASTFPQTGTTGDTSGNTLQCRAYHAGVATGSAALAATHCPHASPLGGASETDGTQVYCGTLCQNYCNLVIGACNSTVHKQYNSRSECETTCAAFAIGNVGATSGDSTSCRVYHAAVALRGDGPARDTHCPHAGPSGGAACGDIVESVCDIEVAACGLTGTNAQWATKAACITALTAIPAGTFGATSGNSLQCRLYHGMVALNGDASAKTTHCPHVAATSTACAGALPDSGSASASSSAGLAVAAVLLGAIAVL